VVPPTFILKFLVFACRLPATGNVDSENPGLWQSCLTFSSLWRFHCGSRTCYWVGHFLYWKLN